MSKPLVFVPEPIAPEGITRLEEFCAVSAPWLQNKPCGEIPAEAEAVMVRIFSLTQKRIAAAKNLRVIAKHGVGFDNIDVSCANSRNIKVVWTPDANAESVSQHTVALMLALSNRIIPANNGVRSGNFDDRLMWKSMELQGRTLGIIGLGRIGNRTALKAIHGFGMNTIAYDPYVNQVINKNSVSLVPTLKELLEKSDYISLHVPLTIETNKLINFDRISAMKPGSFLINTSRGEIVDIDAVSSALESGHIAGAALDVFPQEPPNLNHPIFSSPNTLLTPHIAGLSDRAVVRVATEAADGIIDVLQGRNPRHEVPKT